MIAVNAKTFPPSQQSRVRLVVHSVLVILLWGNSVSGAAYSATGRKTIPASKCVAFHCGTTSATTGSRRSSTVQNHCRHKRRRAFSLPTTKTTTTAASADDSLEGLCQNLNQALRANNGASWVKNAKVEVGVVSQHRLGLVATQSLKRNEVALSCPYDELLQFTAEFTRKKLLPDILPNNYDGWTGDVGLIAMSLLNEVARSGGAGISKPNRSAELQSLVAAWIQALPSLEEMKQLHPLLWEESLQEVLQASSTRKIYRTLDDIEEDATWLQERVWSADRTKFPEHIMVESESIPCFCLDGFRWAVAIVTSRAFFVDGALRLIPILDFANHNDETNRGAASFEVTGGTMGTFGTTACAQVRAPGALAAGDELLVSYGPKSASDYLLEHGFVPRVAVEFRPSAELTFEVDPNDRFFDDKLDILEFETYQDDPMEPTQTFDVGIGGGEFDGEPDASMMQFLRLVKLGGFDAFLLEAIFRKEVWGHMSLPVSEANERDVVDAILEVCSNALDEMKAVEQQQNSDLSSTPQWQLCASVRQAETRALTSTMEFLSREREALDLKEYYQERRLKDMGLDIPWNPEEEGGYDDPGMTRVPGGGELDW